MDTAPGLNPNPLAGSRIQRRNSISNTRRIKPRLLTRVDIRSTSGGMNRQALGWTDDLKQAFAEHAAAGLVPGRVVLPSGGTALVETEQGPLNAFLAGRLRCDAEGDATAAPAVGDWVALRQVDDETGLIEALLPRRGTLIRKGAGRTSGGQILASHVDMVWLVQGLDRGVNPGWLERALALAIGSDIEPVVVLAKADLGAVEAALEQCRVAAPGVKVLPISAAEGWGLHELGPGPGRTAVLLGASGAGKSTLINVLVGHEFLATQTVREGDAKGRHTTTRRELVVLPGGGMVIDTPGIRELGLWGGDVDAAFPEIEALAPSCRYRDCSHTDEPGCAVLVAVGRGEVEPARLERYQRLHLELESLELRQDAAAQRKEGKRFARMVKEAKRISNRRR